MARSSALQPLPMGNSKNMPSIGWLVIHPYLRLLNSFGISYCSLKGNVVPNKSYRIL